MDISKLKVAELRAELKSRGLDTKGLKKVLADRLKEAVAKEEEEAKEDTMEEVEEAQDQAEPEQSTGQSAAASDAEAAPEPMSEDQTAADAHTSPSPAPSAEDHAEQPPGEDAEADQAASGEGKKEIDEATDEKKRPLDEKDSSADVTQEADAKEAPRPTKRARGKAWALDAASTFQNDTSVVTTDSLKDIVPGFGAGFGAAAKPQRKSPPAQPAKGSLEKKSGTATATGSEATEKVDEKPQTNSHMEVSEAPADEATDTLFVKNFVRPFPQRAAKALFTSHGDVSFYFMNAIRTHCYVTFSEAAQAAKAHKAVDGLVFPAGFGKALSASFVSADEAKNAEQEEVSKRAKRMAGPGVGQRGVAAGALTDRTGRSALPRTPARGLARGGLMAQAMDAAVSQPAPAAHQAGERAAAGAKEGGPVPKQDEAASAESEESGPGLDDLFRKTVATPPIYWLPNPKVEPQKKKVEAPEGDKGKDEEKEKGQEKEDKKEEAVQKEEEEKEKTVEKVEETEGSKARGDDK